MKKQHFSVFGDKNGVLAEACRGLAEGLQRACRGLGEGLAMSWRGLERTWKELGRVLGTMCRRGVGSNCRMDERNYSAHLHNYSATPPRQNPQLTIMTFGCSTPRCGRSRFLNNDCMTLSPSMIFPHWEWLNVFLTNTVSSVNSDSEAGRI